MRRSAGEWLTVVDEPREMGVVRTEVARARRMLEQEVGIVTNLGNLERGQWEQMAVALGIVPNPAGRELSQFFTVPFADGTRVIMINGLGVEPSTLGVGSTNCLDRDAGGKWCIKVLEVGGGRVVVEELAAGKRSANKVRERLIQLGYGPGGAVREAMERQERGERDMFGEMALKAGVPRQLAELVDKLDPAAEQNYEALCRLHQMMAYLGQPGYTRGVMGMMGDNWPLVFRAVAAVMGGDERVAKISEVRRRGEGGRERVIGVEETLTYLQMYLVGLYQQMILDEAGKSKGGMEDQAALDYLKKQGVTKSEMGELIERLKKNKIEG